MNQVQLVGRLGADPEMKNGVCKIRLATNERIKTDNGWENKAEWHSVVCFTHLAENVEKFCTKGSQVAVLGKIKTNEWEDKDGNKRKTTEIIARNVEFLGTKEKPQNEQLPVVPF
jgi:single-strand DNA-binding protein